MELDPQLEDFLRKNNVLANPGDCSHQSIQQQRESFEPHYRSGLCIAFLMTSNEQLSLASLAT